MSKEHKTLALHRETILQLTPHQLGGVHGGTSDLDESSSGSSVIDAIADGAAWRARNAGAATRGVRRVAGRVTSHVHKIDPADLAGLPITGVVQHLTQGIANQVAHNKPVNQVHTAVIRK